MFYAKRVAGDSGRWFKREEVGETPFECLMAICEDSARTMDVYSLCNDVEAFEEDLEVALDYGKERNIQDARERLQAVKDGYYVLMNADGAWAKVTKDITLDEANMALSSACLADFEIFERN